MDLMLQKLKIPLIVPGILPVPRVIQHDGQTAAISIVGHKTRSCIEIDNAHYLVSYLRINYVDFQYSLLNSPAFLFVGREGGGKARLTIGHIILSAVRVARPPNAPAFRIPIVDRACTIHVSTFPSRKHPVP